MAHALNPVTQSTMAASSNAPPLAGIKACVFDAYGTLFDMASAVDRSRELLGAKATELASRWRDKQLQYTWLRGLQNRHADFWQVTEDALDHTLATLQIAVPEVRAQLMDSYLRLTVFPEVPDVLRQIKAAGIKLAILSNGTPAMLASAIRNAGLDGIFDAVLSVEEVGVYKPHPKVYELALVRLGIAASEIAFQSSNAWDAHAASAFDMRVVWCNRYGGIRERLPGIPDFEVNSLAELPFLVGATVPSSRS